MSVNYNSFAKTFSQSRKNMKWEEIEYFLSFLSHKKDISILDVGCGNGRFLGALKEKFIEINNYLGVDLSRGLLNEAKKMHPEDDFRELNMLNIETLDVKFSHIFFIASFHHLQTKEERISVLKQAYSVLRKGGKIFMTNWALNSKLNAEKYHTSIVKNSMNTFGSKDYSIKIGGNQRYYHCFHLDELDYLAGEAGFEVGENRLFDTDKNYITILKK